jgi:hypothetical protein
MLRTINNVVETLGAAIDDANARGKAAVEKANADVSEFIGCAVRVVVSLGEDQEIIYIGIVVNITFETWHGIPVQAELALGARANGGAIERIPFSTITDISVIEAAE